MPTFSLILKRWVIVIFSEIPNFIFGIFFRNKLWRQSFLILNICFCSRRGSRCERWRTEPKSEEINFWRCRCPGRRRYHRYCHRRLGLQVIKRPCLARLQRRQLRKPDLHLHRQKGGDTRPVSQVQVCGGQHQRRVLHLRWRVKRLQRIGIDVVGTRRRKGGMGVGDWHGQERGQIKCLDQWESCRIVPRYELSSEVKNNSLIS